MAKTMQVGDPTYYQAKPGSITEIGSVVGEKGREPAVTFEYALPDAEAMQRPHVTIEIDPQTRKPSGRKLERAWDPATDGTRFARTRALASDLLWDKGRMAWIVKGHGLKVEKNPGLGIDRELFIPDWSHPENLVAEKGD